jgi:hypothetical protein
VQRLDLTVAALVAARRQRNSLRHARRTEQRVRKATAFRGRANKTALPCNALKELNPENVPVEHFQRINSNKINFRELADSSLFKGAKSSLIFMFKKFTLRCYSSPNLKLHTLLL